MNATANGTHKTETKPNATGPAARAPTRGETRNRARGGGRRADVVARVEWDVLSAHRNDGLVERLASAARAWWVGQQVRQVKRQAMHTAHAPTQAGEL